MLVSGAAGVLGVVLLMGLQLLSARADLQAAQAEVSTIRDAISDGDLDAARQSLSTIQDKARGARSTLDQPQWALAARVPFVGDDVAAVRTVTTAVDDIGSDVLPPLVDLTDQVNAGVFAPSGGRFEFGALRAVASDLRDAEATFRDASDPVADLDTDGLVGALRGPVREAQDQLAEASSVLSRLGTVADILPDMTEGDRDYLVVFTNNAELRAQGGLPGAWAQIKIRDGKVSVGKQGSGGSTVTDAPVEQLSFANIQAFPNGLAADFRDTAYTPDTPTAARLQSALVQRVAGVATDGVISLDPVTLSYLLRAIGPVQVTPRITLTPDNAVDLLLSRIYALETNPDRQDAFFALVTRTMFERVADGEFDPQVLAQGLVRGGSEGRIHVWSKDVAVQQRLAGTLVGGALPAGATNPAIGLYLNDLTGAKMNYYLTFSARARAIACSAEGVQTYQMKLVMGSRAPSPETLPSYVLGDGEPPGSMTISLDILGAEGGGQPAFSRAGRELPSDSFQVGGRPGSRIPVQIDPGGLAVITVTMTSPPGTYGPTAFAQTPTITSGDIPGTIPSACL